MKNVFLLFFLMFLGLNLHSQTTTTTTSPKTYDIFEIQTALGNIYIWFYDQTPKHKANYLKLANDSFFDGITFHRVIPNFVIQGGDPLTKDSNPMNDGLGGPGYNIDSEILPALKHVYGAVGAAREGDEINPLRQSSGSQFYIVMNPNGTPHLDGRYTVFGIVFSGMDVAEAIAKQPTGQNNRPITNVTMKVRVVTMTAEELKTKYNFVVPL